jgi:hypothetical protein
MRKKRKSYKNQLNRDIITGKELDKLLGPTPITPKWWKPVFINNGSGNGHLVWPDGTIQYYYIR